MKLGLLGKRYLNKAKGCDYMKFYVTYWLHKQSKMFSRPQLVVVDTPDELRDIVLKCEKHGYEIENIVSM